MSLHCIRLFNFLKKKKKIRLKLFLLSLCGKTRQDKIINDIIRERERVGVAPMVIKMEETKLRWFEHVERRDVDYD